MLYYSIFKYKSIVLGILFHEPSFDHREFKYISELSQFEAQYPEFDIKMIEKLLIGIKDQVKSAESFDIEDFTRFYLNDFHFEEMQWEEYGDLDGIIDRIFKGCL